MPDAHTAENFRVTYATLTADNEALHAAYEGGIETARGWLGAEITAAGDPDPGEPITVTSPADPEVVVATVRPASRSAIDTAFAAARASAPGWAATGWRERVALMRVVADRISDASNELAALMTIEVGKNRLEALGDVEESAVFFRYYADQFEANNGFDAPMEQLSDAEQTRSVLRPHGVWAVISPFNFPMALAAGPTAGALVAGNTVVIKPSPQGSLVAAKLYELLIEAGVPTDVLHLLPGGDEVGRAVAGHAEVDGLTFTGSYEAGMSILRGAVQSPYPRPVVAEMGGKNPTIITASADLDAAAEGVARSAFGFSGQKCSACSRVYVDASIHDAFVDALVERGLNLALGDPLDRATFVGPVINEESVERYNDAVDQAKERGEIRLGGEVLRGRDGLPGQYVAPTVVTGLAPDDDLLRRELFLPFVAVVPVASLDQALELANDSVFGLTAGFFSGEQGEIDEFLERIEAGVVYVNRRAGATTGAWPGVQPFGGWKGSGSSGKAGGGLHYVQLFLREQSRTVVG